MFIVHSNKQLNEKNYNWRKSSIIASKQSIDLGDFHFFFLKFVLCLHLFSFDLDQLIFFQRQKFFPPQTTWYTKHFVFIFGACTSFKECYDFELKSYTEILRKLCCLCRKKIPDVEKIFVDTKQLKSIANAEKNWGKNIKIAMLNWSFIDELNDSENETTTTARHGHIAHTEHTGMLYNVHRN